MKSILAYLLSIAIGMCLMSEVVSVNLHFTPVLSRKASELDVRQNLVAAILPGDPLITGTLGQGLSNGISLYSNVLFARYVTMFTIEFDFLFLHSLALLCHGFLNYSISFQSCARY